MEWTCALKTSEYSSLALQVEDLGACGEGRGEDIREYTFIHKLFLQLIFVV